MGKNKHKAKNQCKRVRHLALDTALSREDIKAISVMALIETLLIDHLSFATPERGKIIKGMQNLLNQLNKIYIGHVPPHMIDYADRYLCRVQSAMDGFFDDLTEHDKAEMERVKSDWGVGVGVDPTQAAEAVQ